MERFDERMRLRAQGESMTASPEVKQKIADAIRKGRRQASKKRDWRIPAWAAGFAVAACLMIWMIQPPTDTTPNNAVFAQPDGLPSPVPVTEIQAEMELTMENRELQATATFSNHTGDIWLIRWWAEPQTPMQASHHPLPLIWLETGITFHDQAEWLPAGQPATAADWGYDAYRMKADVLHWLDGDWLLPGQEGYEEQQDLMEDAFQCGALILCTGDWPDGTSGEMQLILPDSQKDVDPLDYYVQLGCLELAASVRETAYLTE